VVTALRYIAIDLHKKYAVVAEKADGSPEIKSSRFRLTPSGVQTFRRNVDANCRIVMEATGNAFWLHDQLCPVAGEVILANPGQLKAIATARIKNDKLDATVMVQLLAADFIPRVWVPDPKTRAQRSLLSHRFSLRRTATRCKNQVHAALTRNNVHVARPFTREGRRKLAEVDLTPEDRATVDSDLRLLDFLQGEIAAIGGELNAEAVEGPRKEEIQLAMTLPGLDVLGASLLVARIGDIARFPEPDRLASYFGLVPQLHQSGRVDRRGHITKAGCPEARHVLVQAAWVVVRHYRDTPLYTFYERVAQRRGASVAIVALARKLATILWQVLTKHEPCHHCRPATLARKLRRARRHAVRYPVMTDAERAERLAALLVEEVATGSG
jgi:transposase